jgi:hypothetical protein
MYIGPVYSPFYYAPRPKNHYHNTKCISMFSIGVYEVDGRFIWRRVILKVKPYIYLTS